MNSIKTLELKKTSPGDSPRAAGKRKFGINIALWIAQGILALLFMTSGYMKTFQPLGVLGQSISWVPDVPGPLVRFIGISELLGAIGLVIPAATRILPRLTTLAAAGLAVVMASASLFHITRGEFIALPVTGALFALATFVAYGRQKLAPFPPRE